MEDNKKEQGRRLTMKGNWQNQSKDLKTQFPTLTDSDLKYTKGGEDELIKRLEERLGKDRGEVISLITKGQK